MTTNLIHLLIALLPAAAAAPLTTMQASRMSPALRAEVESAAPGEPIHISVRLRRDMGPIGMGESYDDWKRRESAEYDQAAAGVVAAARSADTCVIWMLNEIRLSVAPENVASLADRPEVRSLDLSKPSQPEAGSRYYMIFYKAETEGPDLYEVYQRGTDEEVDEAFNRHYRSLIAGRAPILAVLERIRAEHYYSSIAPVVEAVLTHEQAQSIRELAFVSRVRPKQPGEPLP